MTNVIDIKLRPMEVGDASFIIDSWCSSYSRSPVVGPVDPQLFKIEQRNLVYGLIPKCRIVVACDPSRPSAIRAWIAVEPPRDSGGLWILHYACTRPELQRQGIFKSLVAPFRAVSPEGMMFGTHYTHACKLIGKDWLMYNPYLLRNSGTQPASRPQTVISDGLL